MMLCKLEPRKTGIVNTQLTQYLFLIKIKLVMIITRLTKDLLYAYRTVYMFPERTPENYQVVLYKLKDSDPAKFNFIHFTKL